jgi:hypothetical protein
MKPITPSSWRKLLLGKEIRCSVKLCRLLRRHALTYDVSTRYVIVLIYTDYSVVMFKSFVHKDLWRNDYSAVMLKLKLDQEMWPIGHFLLRGVVCARPCASLS